MLEFLGRTVSDPTIFWPALEALATAIAAGIIIWQLRRLREESVAHRFDGFRYAMELLASSEFKEQAGSFFKFLERGDPAQFRQALPPLVHWILRTLETLAQLISDKHLDEDFLFRIEGRRLGHLARHIRMMEDGRDTPRFEDEIRLFPNGRDLLRKAEAWDDRN